MKLNTPSERFFVFMATVMLFGVGYQHYFNYQTNKTINEELEKQNVLVGRYTYRNYELLKENVGLKHDLLHAQSENMSLVDQVDYVSGYYQAELTKLKEVKLRVNNKTKEVVKKVLDKTASEQIGPTDGIASDRAREELSLDIAREVTRLLTFEK